MIAALKHADASVRRKAASALLFAFMQPPGIEERFEPALLEAMKDEEERVRFSIASTLSYSKSDDTLHALIEALRDKSAMVRSFAARSLGHREDPRAIDALAAAAEDKEEEVMAAATAALQTLSPGHPTARKQLAKLIRLFRKGAGSAFQAASALGQIGTPEAIEVLMEGLEAKSDHDRHFALMGLMYVSEIPRVGPIVRCLRDKNSHVRMSAVMVLERVDPAGFAEWVSPLLEDEDAMVRMMTAASLMRKGDTRGEAVIQGFLDSEEEHERSFAEAMMAAKASMK